MRSLLLFLAVPLFAATNSVTLTELTGSTQTARPVTISRVFVKGEIAAYAQPSIGGTPLTTWQCDRRSQWADGSLKHALISFTTTLSGNGSATVSFVNNASASSSGSALTQTQMLAFDPGTGASTWGADMEATNGATFTANVRTMLAAGFWRYNMQGPVVTQVIVEDRAPATRTYDFGWQCTTNCTSGNYSAATWISAPSATYKSLHPVFVLSFYAGWSGVKVEYILENPWSDRLQDQYYSVSLKSHSDLSSTKYTHAAFGHNLGSNWRKVFWDGATPARMKTDLNFAYLIQSHAIPNYDQTRVVGCCGATTSGGLEIAQYKSGIANSASFLTALPENLTDLREIPTWQPDWGATGGRPDIGLFTRWDAKWLYTQDDQLFRVMIGEATASGQPAWHIREARTDNFELSPAQEPGQTTKAAGHAISVDGRPTGSHANWTYGTSSDQLAPVGTCKYHSGGFNLCTAFVADPDANLWNLDEAHQPSMVYTSYLATGDYYWKEELYFASNWAMYEQNPATTDGNSRNGRDGIINPFSYNERGYAWGLRTLMMGAYMAADADPEKQALNEKVVNNIAAMEGFYNYSAGYYSATAQWTFGNTYLRNFNMVSDGGSSAANPLFIGSYNPYNNCVANPDCSSRFDASQVKHTESSYWQASYRLMTYGLMQDFGFPIDRLNSQAFKFFINIIQAPGTSGYSYNPYLVGTYGTPALDISGNWFQTMPALYALWVSAYHDATDWFSETTVGNTEHEYDVLALTAMSFGAQFTSGTLTGLDSYNWLVAHVTTQSQFGSNVSNCGALVQNISNCDNPRWAILPRAAAACAINTSSLPNGTVGAAYNQTLTQTGCGASTWTISAGSLTGCNLSLNSATGAITGTPASATTCPITAAYDTTTQALSVTVNAAGAAPTITTSSLPGGTVGTAYSQTLAATGSTPITWAVTAGSLCGGLGLASNGVLNGTPTTVQTCAFSATATNGVGSNTAALSIAVVGVTGAGGVRVSGLVILR